MDGSQIDWCLNGRMNGWMDGLQKGEKKTAIIIDWLTNLNMPKWIIYGWMVDWLTNWLNEGMDGWVDYKKVRINCVIIIDWLIPKINGWMDDWLMPKWKNGW